MLTILFIVLAAVCKAVADTLAHHFSTSVFKWKDPRWWNPAISWQHVGFIRFTKYRADAWHLANSGMILFFIIAAIVFEPVNIHIGSFHLSIWGGFLVVIYGYAFILPFNLFYNKILRRV